MDLAQLSFSSDFITAMIITLFVGSTIPVLYFIFYVFKKRINYVAVLTGLIGYLILGVYISGFLQCLIIPEARLGEIGPVLFSLIQAAIIGLVNGGGIYLVLRLLAGRYDSTHTPISVGLGFPLEPMIFQGAISAANALALASQVNEQGLSPILDTIDSVRRAEFEQTLREMAARPVSDLIFTAARFACFFVICVALTRLLWNALHGDKRAPSRLFIPAGLILNVIAEIPVSLIRQNVVENNVAINCIYFAITAVIAALSVIASRLWDEKEKVVSGPLNRRLL